MDNSNYSTTTISNDAPIININHIVSSLIADYGDVRLYPIHAVYFQDVSDQLNKKGDTRGILTIYFGFYHRDNEFLYMDLTDEVLDLPEYFQDTKKELIGSNLDITQATMVILGHNRIQVTLEYTLKAPTI